jgi:hypothetical protein
MLRAVSGKFAAGEEAAGLGSAVCESVRRSRGESMRTAMAPAMTPSRKAMGKVFMAKNSQQMDHTIPRQCAGAAFHEDGRSPEVSPSPGLHPSRTNAQISSKRSSFGE